MPAITVIIPAIGQIKDIKKLIYSVLNQNFQDFEILIISNNSLHLTQIDPRVRNSIISNKSSIPELINAGIENTNSKYICFLHPDDLLLYNAIDLRYKEFLKDSSIVACYGSGIETDLSFRIKVNNTYEKFLKKPYEEPDNNFTSVLSNRITPTITSLMIKKEIFRDLKFNEAYKIHYFKDFLIRLNQKYNNQVTELQEVIYLTSNKVAEIKQYNKSYFTKNLRETQYILDKFFDENAIHDDLKHYIYKANYLSFFDLLIEHFPASKLLKLYLLGCYLNKNTQLDNKLFETWYFYLLINSIITNKDLLLKENIDQLKNRIINVK